MDIVIMLDESMSLSKEDWIQARAAAEKLVEFMQPEDRAAVMYLNFKTPRCKFTSDKEKIIKGINQLKSPAGAYTRIGDCIERTMALYQDDPDREKVLYIFSDGEPTDEEKAITMAGEAADMGITIYTLGLRKSGEEFLSTVAEIGNGTYVYSPANSELVDMMEKLAGDMFKVAGSNVSLSMTLGKEMEMEQITISPQPDEMIDNKDGSKTVVFNRDYLSVGFMENISLGMDTGSLQPGKMLNIASEIKLSYINQFDEEVVMELDPINIRVDNLSKEETVTPQEPDDLDVEIDENAVVALDKDYETEVTEAPVVNIRGDVSVSVKDALTGDDVKAAYQVENLGDKRLEEAWVTINLINVDTEEVEVTHNLNHAMDLNETIKDEVEIDTLNIAEGEYLVTLNAIHGDEQIFLGATGFTLLEPRYNISVVAGEGGTVNEEVNGEYRENSSIELVATPNDGYIFAGWNSDNGGMFENEYGETTTFVTSAADTVIKAEFVKYEEPETDDKESGDKEKDSADREDVTNTEQKIEVTTDTKDKHSLSENGANRDKQSEEETVTSESEEVTTGNVKMKDDGPLEDVVKTGDYTERAIIIRNITIMLLMLVPVSMVMTKKESKEEE